MDKHVQHVQVPDPKESDDLRLIDRLVYANIKRFMNKDTFTAYPSKKTIADKCKVTEKTVANSIRNLVKNGYIEILPEKHNGRNNVYRFKKLLKDFEMFTPEFLDKDNITPEEKAYIIGFQSQCYKESPFMISDCANKETASNLNISESTVKRNNASLMRKGIMTELQTARNDKAGFAKIVRAISMTAIGQQFLFEVSVNHEDRISNLEKLVDELIRTNTSLRKENEELRSKQEEFSF